MVFFTCNSCGESLKKNKVEQHTWKCKTNSIACVDCLKDFNLNSYSSHNDCMTEEQKYGGQDFKQKEFKGKNKQNNWISEIKKLSQQNNYPKNIQNILNSLVNFENVPRKKAKFLNFIKNSFRLRNDPLANEIWDIFEKSIKNNGTNSVNNIENEKVNYNQNGTVRRLEDETNESQSDVKKMKVICGKKEIVDDSNEKIKMKKVIKTLILQNENIGYSKLGKKVLKFYQERGYSDDSDVMEKFGKVFNKNYIFENDKIVRKSTK